MIQVLLFKASIFTDCLGEKEQKGKQQYNQSELHSLSSVCVEFSCDTKITPHLWSVPKSDVTGKIKCVGLNTVSLIMS